MACIPIITITTVYSGRIIGTLTVTQLDTIINTIARTISPSPILNFHPSDLPQSGVSRITNLFAFKLADTNLSGNCWNHLNPVNTGSLLPMSCDLRLASVSPQIRYVDTDRAIVDVLFAVTPVEPSSPKFNPEAKIEVLLDIDGADGFHDEGRAHVRLNQGMGCVRFEIVHPQRWWPANMGEQPLYELTIGLLVDQIITDSTGVLFGLSSVRQDPFTEMSLDPTLLVNGEVCDIESIVIVDQYEDQNLLPESGGSLLVVRDHFAPDVLFEAADRAGILLIQCFPEIEETDTDEQISQAINRISPHPSLAGWYVGNHGDKSQKIADRIKKVDPTHTIFHEFPLVYAA
ncbi:Exo-beta-D-glucosaminidase precursor [Poriferisphaera corsica]|uniref:Exo-beta-D-glucosaminidase n=2 Tax=Poriferisphaera corsica TaxID=2528020 RepID=A0A517YVH9_9BACT|nr:Exo-beta-D-glucosaminidase precursor [Poriferisphaera corsica]